MSIFRSRTHHIAKNLCHGSLIRWKVSHTEEVLLILLSVGELMTYFHYSLAQLLALDLASNCEIVIEQVLSPKFANDHLRERASSIDLDQEEFWLGTDNVSHRKNPSNLIRLRPPIAVYVSFYTSDGFRDLTVMLKCLFTFTSRLLDNLVLAILVSCGLRPLMYCL